MSPTFGRRFGAFSGLRPRRRCQPRPWGPNRPGLVQSPRLRCGTDGPHQRAPAPHYRPGMRAPHRLSGRQRAERRSIGARRKISAKKGKGPLIRGRRSQMLRPTFGDKRPTSREYQRGARSMAADAMKRRPAVCAATARHHHVFRARRAAENFAKNSEKVLIAALRRTRATPAFGCCRGSRRRTGLLRRFLHLTTKGTGIPLPNDIDRLPDRVAFLDLKNCGFQGETASTCWRTDWSMPLRPRHVAERRAHMAKIIAAVSRPSAHTCNVGPDRGEPPPPPPSWQACRDGGSPSPRFNATARVVSAAVRSIADWRPLWHVAAGGYWPKERPALPAARLAGREDDAQRQPPPPKKPRGKNELNKHDVCRNAAVRAQGRTRRAAIGQPPSARERPTISQDQRSPARTRLI